MAFEPMNFLYEISLISFWIEHKGAWYVAMSIVLYMIYPLYYLMIKKAGIEKSTVISIVFVLVLGALIELQDGEIYSHLSKVLNSFIAASIGTLAAYLEQREKKIYLEVLIATGIYFLVMQVIPMLKYFHFLSSLRNLLVGICLAYIAAAVFSVIHCKFVKKLFKIIGNYSLELYLSQIYLIQLYLYLALHGLKIGGFARQFVYYLIIVIGSFIISILSRRILRSLKKQDKRKEGER